MSHESLGVQPPLVAAARDVLHVGAAIRRCRARRFDNPGFGVGWGEWSSVGVEEVQLAIGNVELFHGIRRAASRALVLQIMRRAHDRRGGRGE